MSRIILPTFPDIIEHLANLPWPILIDQFSPHAQALGWTHADEPNKYAIQTLDDEPERVNFSAPTHRIDQVYFGLAKRGNTVAEDNDAFIEATTLARHRWGDPYRIDPGKMASMGWRLPNNCLVEISQGMLFFYTPTGWYLY